MIHSNPNCNYIFSKSLTCQISKKECSPFWPHPRALASPWPKKPQLEISIWNQSVSFSQERKASGALSREVFIPRSDHCIELIPLLDYFSPPFELKRKVRASSIISCWYGRSWTWASGRGMFPLVCVLGWKCIPMYRHNKHLISSFILLLMYKAPSPWSIWQRFSKQLIWSLRFWHSHPYELRKRKQIALIHSCHRIHQYQNNEFYGN